jgi:hypothetical protein
MTNPTLSSSVLSFLCADAAGRVLVAVYSWRGDDIRLTPPAAPNLMNGRNTKGNENLPLQQRQTRSGTPGASGQGANHDPAGLGIVDYFRDQVERARGGNYQTVINDVLRDYIEGKKSAPGLEDTLRRVIREELQKVS